MKRLCCLISAVCLLSGRLAAAGDPAESRFGFTGPEIFPIDNLVSMARAADLDGDGLNDIVLVNNARSKLNLLYNQTGKTNRVQLVKPFSREINELPPDARFRIDSIASEKRISGLVVEDLNGDGRPDLAYYGDPKELIVIYNQGTNGWTQPRRWPIDDGQLTPNALTTGDLNGDQRPDLLLLADNEVYLFYQDADHSLREPEKLPFTGDIRSAQIVDVDGDGRQDLLLVNWDDRQPFRFRLQRHNGELGPEISLASPPIRAYWADNLIAGERTKIITIALNSGRAQVSEFRTRSPEKLADELPLGQFQVLPLNRTEKARRGTAWGDLSGDGLPELVVAEPESGQVAVYFQQDAGGLSIPSKFPTLAGVTDLAIGDWDGDGRTELFLLSADERQVGVARMDENRRLPFPTLLSLPGRPVALALEKPATGKSPVLAVVTESEGKRSVLTRTASGEQRVQALNENFRATPARFTFHDVDQDGLEDLVVLAPYEKVKILRRVPNAPFEEIDVVPPGGVLEQPSLSLADLDGDERPELLLAQRNFLRAVVLRRDTEAASSNTWVFAVKEQINGAGNNSRIAGATALRDGIGGTHASLCLLDTERKQMSLCSRDKTGVWRITRNIPLPYSEFTQIRDVSISGRAALAFEGRNAVAYMPLHGQTWELQVLDAYETPIRDGRLTDVVTGDLDNDGRKDLVFLETGRNYVDLVMFGRDQKLTPANRWPVFEERTFRGRTSNLPEPREALVEDLTGDGKNDLLVLVHDRVLLYPQE